MYSAKFNSNDQTTSWTSWLTSFKCIFQLSDISHDSKSFREVSLSKKRLNSILIFSKVIIIMPKKKVKLITQKQIRSLFNKTIYPKKREGKFSEIILKESYITDSPNGSDCEKSQLIKYENDEGIEVARVHQYLRKDGTLGASGLPDPKRICQKGTVYACDSPKQK